MYFTFNSCVIPQHLFLHSLLFLSVSQAHSPLFSVEPTAPWAHLYARIFPCSQNKMILYLCVVTQPFIKILSLWLWFLMQLSCCSHSYSKFLKCHSTVHERRYPRFLIHCLLGHFHQVCLLLFPWLESSFPLACPRELISWKIPLVFLSNEQWRATRNHRGAGANRK